MPKAGRALVAASGNMKSPSSTVGMPPSGSGLDENWAGLLSCLINSVDGVAGSLPLLGLLLCAGIFGDLPADRGMEGGGIKMSVSGSGLTESGPEPSLLPTGLCLNGPGLAVKSWLLAILATLAELALAELGFRRCWDFASGDCLALRAGARLDMLDFRPLFLAAGFEVATAFDVSRWASTGELVAPVSELGALG